MFDNDSLFAKRAPLVDLVGLDIEVLLLSKGTCLTVAKDEALKDGVCFKLFLLLLALAFNDVVGEL